jgi:hypothetical protein
MLSKENLTEGLMLIMLTCLRTRTILLFKLLTTLISLGKPIPVSSKSITLVMDPTAKNTRLFHLLKPPLELRKNPKPHLLDNKRTLKPLGMKQKNIKITIAQLRFQSLSFQLISIGETLMELISLLNTEIKAIVDLATPSLSLKLSKIV